VQKYEIPKYLQIYFVFSCPLSQGMGRRVRGAAG
jgi:hypothetical protein